MSLSDYIKEREDNVLNKVHDYSEDESQLVVELINSFQAVDDVLKGNEILEANQSISDDTNTHFVISSMAQNIWYQLFGTRKPGSFGNLATQCETTYDNMARIEAQFDGDVDKLSQHDGYVKMEYYAELNEVRYDTMVKLLKDYCRAYHLLTNEDWVPMEQQKTKAAVSDTARAAVRERLLKRKAA